MAKRRNRCKGKTKRGARCQSTSVIAGTDFCFSHQPEEVKRSRGFGGPQPGSGRPRNPRVVDVMRDRVEAQIELVLAPYFDALANAVMHATYEGEVIASEHPDLAGRIAAAEKLLDRVYGKPRQTIEHAGPLEGAAIPVQFTLDEKVRSAIGDALRSRPATGAD